MGYWKDDDYYYVRSELEYIARNYRDYLDVQISGVSYDRKRGETHYNIDYSKDALRLDKLSSKIDFDKALDALGKGHWSGTHWGDSLSDVKWKTYKSFGWMQQLVIADILGINDYELEQSGFYDIPKFRQISYMTMANRLNRKLDKV